MLAELKQEIHQIIVPLINTIFQDGQKLIVQEIALAKSEIKKDVRSAGYALVSLIVGAMLGFVAIVLFTLMGVYGVHAAYPDIPLWKVFGGAGGIVALISAIIVYSAKRLAASIDFVPKETVESLRENFQWITQKF